MTTSTKYVYLFGSSRTDGAAAMKNLLGGKGANLAEMCRLGITVPSGFTLSTEACTAFTELGRSLCEHEGKFQKVEELLERRDEASKAYFSTPQARATLGYATEFPAFLRAFSHLLDSRRLAIDVGTGDGRMLDLLAPTFEHVVAVDRSEAQIQTAKERVRLRNYSNVKLLVSEVSSAELKRLAKPGADVVVASRVLHHAPSPGDRVKELSELLRPGGTLLVIDYATHEDESMREKADLWLGFAPAELKKFARSAGFDSVHLEPLPRSLTGEGEDGHLEWQILIAKKARAS